MMGMAYGEENRKRKYRNGRHQRNNGNEAMKKKYQHHGENRRKRK